MKIVSAVAATALAAAALTTAPALPAYAAPVPSSPTASRAVEAGAAWLTGQLTDGLVHNDQFGGFDDYGLSADFAFALRAVGKDAVAAEIADAVEPVSESWVSGAGFGMPDRVYAGSLAKLVSLAQATGHDATAFDGTDQVARLEELVSASAPLTGRLEDAGVDPADQFDADFVNVIGQSFASRALTTAGSPRAADATTFLLDQQCDEGFFRAQLTADKAAAEQGCTAADTGSVDTTAITVLNILETEGASRPARGAAALAADWLKTQQADDGSFSAGETEGYNANTTGLAAWALSRAGETAAAAKAAAWLRTVQIADLAPCATSLAADNGGVAYKPEILAAARTSGIAPGARDQYRRTTAQVVPALASAPAAAGPLGLVAPASAVEKSTVTVDVTGLGQGESACVSLGGVAKSVTGTGGTVPVRFDLPAGAGSHTFRLATLGATSTATTVATTVVTTAPAPAKAVGDLRAGKVVKVTGNRFTLRVACGGPVACEGRLSVRPVGKVELANGRKRQVLLARSSYSVEAGRTGKVRLRLTKAARSALGPKRLRVVAVQKARGVEPATTKFWLRRK